MTYRYFKRAGLVTLAALTFSATLPAASAMAAEAPTGTFQVSSTTDGLVKLGVKAFKRGDYERAVKMNEQALRSSLSRRKTAIAQSNLCASYAKLDMMDKAQEACTAALELRPDYAPALANKNALTIRLAQNITQP